MKRRIFSKNILLGSGLVSLAACTTTKPNYTMSKQNKIIKPKRLSKGDTIGLIAPASAFDDEGYNKTVKQLKSLGFNIKNAKNLFKKWGYLAGSDQDRVDDIHQMFSDSSIDGIWCVRGGYGVTRILHMLDYNLIRNNPKILIGYSDITALSHAIFLNTGLVGFHGPVGVSSMSPYTLKYVHHILMNPTATIKIENKISNDKPLFQPYTITSGRATGRLAGGNLSLLSALVGTDNHWDATDKLVFIEDIGEQPYSIDRMLTQLIQGANLHKAKGIILGVFKGCEKDDDGEASLSLKEVFEDRLGNLGIPVFYGYRFGHIKGISTLPVGIEASFDTAIPMLELLEPAVL